jgi:hypothetical protein
MSMPLSGGAADALLCAKSSIAAREYALGRGGMVL